MSSQHFYCKWELLCDGISQEGKKHALWKTKEPKATSQQENNARLL